MPGVDALAPLAIGVDIVDIDRLRRMVQRWGDEVLERLFTVDERACLRGRRGHRWDSLAGRFAAKEATRKVFGSRGEMPRFTDLRLDPGLYGEPVLVLLGDAVAAAGRCGFRRLMVSISHEKRSAVAVVVAV